MFICTSMFMLLACFLVHSCCFSVRSKLDILKVGCMKPIQKGLDAGQGFEPRLTKEFTEFGYIYSMETPSIKLKTDIEVKRSSTQHWLPHEVAGIISQYSLNEATSTFVLHVHISNNNADKIRKTSLVGLPFNVKFGTFAFDRSRYKWYSSFENGTPNGISGIVSDVDLVEPDIDAMQQKVIIELVPSDTEPRHQPIEFFNIKSSSDASLKRIDWSGPRRSGCKRLKLGNMIVADYLDEIVEKDIVL